VLVRTQAASVNELISTVFSRVLPSSAASWGLRVPPQPQIGFGVAGVVEAVGAGVTRFPIRCARSAPIGAGGTTNRRWRGTSGNRCPWAEGEVGAAVAGHREQQERLGFGSSLSRRVTHEGQLPPRVSRMIAAMKEIIR
jgi:hypothetical protein